MAGFLAFTPGESSARTGQGATQGQQAPQTVLDLQRMDDNARARREPVIHLLSDGFVEIQADGRMLPIASDREIRKVGEL